MRCADRSLFIRLDRDFVPLALVPLASGGASNIGLQLEQMDPVGDDILSARIDVPPGEWLLWVQQKRAMWIGHRVDALPALLRHSLGGTDATNATSTLGDLAEGGVWLREAALLIGGEWTASRRAAQLFEDVAPSTITGLSGIFVDRDGRSARLQLAPGGLAWSDRPTLAIQWMLQAARLPAPQ